MRASARRRRASVFIVLSLLYLVVLLFPVYWMAMMMLKPSDLMFVRPTEWAFSPTLSHFEYVVKHGFLGNLVTSLIVSIGSTALVVLIGTPAAYALPASRSGAGTTCSCSSWRRAWPRRWRWRFRFI